MVWSPAGGAASGRGQRRRDGLARGGGGRVEGGWARAAARPGPRRPEQGLVGAGRSATGPPVWSPNGHLVREELLLDAGDSARRSTVTGIVGVHWVVGNSHDRRQRRQAAVAATVGARDARAALAARSCDSRSSISSKAVAVAQQRTGGDATGRGQNAALTAAYGAGFERKRGGSEELTSVPKVNSRRPRTDRRRGSRRRRPAMYATEMSSMASARVVQA